MQITRSSIDTQKGPADWFTRDVYIDSVAAPAGSSTFAAALVHFTPGARTARHEAPGALAAAGGGVHPAARRQCRLPASRPRTDGRGGE
jgi:hypothetical protein